MVAGSITIYYVGKIQDRRHYAQLFKKKADTLSYQFLMRVHNCPQDPAALAKAVAEQEPDIRVRQLLAGCDIVFQTTYERLAAVSSTQVAAWWYIFWVSNDIVQGLQSTKLIR